MKKFLKVLYMFIPLFFLSSCVLFPFGGWVIEQNVDAGFRSDDVKTYHNFSSKEKEKIETSQNGIEKIETKYNYEQVTESYYNFQTLPNVGDVKMLVIPVEFSDYTCSNLLQGCEDTRDLIGNAFFEKTEKTGWESVASYYYKSSYGQLAISGAVLDWYQVGMSARKFSKLKNYNDPTIYILREATKAAKEQLKDAWKDYDSNGDGYIDSVYLVYSVDPQKVDEDVFWAYTYWDYNQEPDYNSPNVFAYSWASYGFMYEGRYPRVDAHTYIHETGHLLGLDDYYSYDTKSKYAPVGGLDMMDYNIGDHNTFSKMSLGWLSPYHVYDSVDIQLKPYESSGECIVIKDDWSGNPFDNYILLEYYTPTGLNEKDALTAYSNSFRMYRTQGVRIWHVDARLGKYQIGFTDDKFISYVDKIESSPKIYTKVAHSNTPSRSQNKDYFLLHLIEATGNNTMKNGETAKENALFKNTDTFPTKKGVYSSFTFNGGEEFPYVITFGMQTSEGAEIHIEKIK